MIIKIELNAHMLRFINWKLNCNSNSNKFSKKIVIFQISCQQVIDYDESDPNGGLGESFQPSIKASCVGGKMTIRVDTNIPFEVRTILITHYKFFLYCAYVHMHIFNQQ